jgi:tetratricopeptide (TPR) repeat protein
MSLRETVFVVRATLAVVFALALPWAGELAASPQSIPEGAAPAADPGTQSQSQSPEAKEPPQTKADEPPPQTPAEARADLYARLAAAKDADETAGIITLLLHAYSESGSDTGDLLLRRARQAIGAEEYPDALKILDATVALLPDWAEGWNARATARYLDDDYDGSMADIAQTLKREPRHLGALMGMAAILEARGKTEDALKVYQRALAIAPHWRNAEEAADRLKAALAGEEL